MLLGRQMILRLSFFCALGSMKRRKIFKLLGLRKAICFVLLLIALKLVLLIHELTFHLATKELPSVLENMLDYTQNKLHIFRIKFHYRLLGRHRRLDRHEKYPKAIDVLENFYYDQQEDMQRNEILVQEEQTIEQVNSTITNSNELPTSLPLCSILPARLKGRLNYKEVFSKLSNLSSRNPKDFLSVSVGGHSVPKECLSRHRVAILVPYRDRAHMLPIFVKYMHIFLANQEIDYSIIIVEQSQNQTFNRGKLLNAGALEALKLYDWQCFIFHDVDHFPIDDLNLYTCPQDARHMAVSMDKFKFSLFYREYFGGVCAINASVFTIIDGFSNDFWGWGGEDDDIYYRFKQNNFVVYRYPRNIARYVTVKHEHDRENPINPCRFKLVDAARNGLWPKSGLSKIRYAVKQIAYEVLYTKITIDLLEMEDREISQIDKFCSEPISSSSRLQLLTICILLCHFVAKFV